MTAAELAAYIGAAAWLPQVAAWAYKAAAKPKLQIIPAPAISIRYDSRGSVARLALSFSAQRRDAVINRAELNVKHEQGDERVLSWVSIGSLSKEDTVVPVTAVKVTTDALVDRRIIFQDIEFASEIRKHVDDLIAQFNFLRTIDPDPLATLLKSKELHDAKEHFLAGYFWKSGKYNAELRIRCNDTVHRQSFRLTISKPDADALRHGCDLFVDYVSSSVLGSIGTPTTSPSWRWINPAITDL